MSAAVADAGATAVDTAPLPDLEAFTLEAPGPDPSPPKRGRGRPPGSPNRPKASDSAPRPRTGGTSARGKREKALLGTLGGIGVGICLVNRRDGEVVLAGAPALADSLAALAEQNPAVARAIDGMNAVGAWSGVFAAAGAIIVPILANHRMLPGGVAAFAAPPSGEAPEPSL